MTRTALTLAAIIAVATTLGAGAQQLQVRPISPNIQNQTDATGMLQNQVEGLKARVAAQDQEIAALKTAIENLAQKHAAHEAAYKSHTHKFVYNSIYAKNSTGNSIVKTPAYTEGPIEAK
jgi:outer membrane murein-binding lipoprotein Lpp